MNLPASPARDSRPFKLGFLTHVHGVGDARRVYAELEELFVVAEELGFDGGWIAQHHLRTEYGRLPSPLVFLAAVAARTQRIELGTAIVTLPLESPLRLAEDAAVLDALSHGRLQLGLGSGGANLDAFEAFGIDVDDKKARFETALQVLTRAIGGAALTQGPATDVALTLEPRARGLADRIWHSHASIDGARYAADQGNGLLLGTAVHDPRTIQKPLADAYLEAWQQRPDRQARPPRIGVVRAVFPAASRTQAYNELAPDVTRHIPWLARNGHPDPDSLTATDVLNLLNVHYGSSDEVTQSLRHDPALLDYADYFIPVVQSESSTLDQCVRRLRTLAETIAPALGWQPAHALA